MLKMFQTKSFFAKLLVTYLVIIFITLTIIGLLLGQLFQNFYYSERENDLKSMGIEINNLVTSFYNQDISYIRLKDQLLSLDRVSKAEIWLVDKDGLIYQASVSSKENVQGTKLNKSQYEQLLKGQTVTKVTKDDTHFNSMMMTVGVPLIINHEVQGATLMHTPVSGIQSSLGRVYRLIALAAVFSVLVAFALIYLISKRISEPIHEMTKISLAIAGGDFSQKVKISTNDEIGQLSATFNYMVAELGKLEQMRKDFIANVSHELRSPLTSIRGFVQGVLDGTIPQEEQHKYLHIVFDETNRLNRLVNDLLELARMEAGNLKLDVKPVELKAILAKVVAQLGPQSSAKEIAISENTPENFMVKADRDLLEQIFINLLDNAIRFTPVQGKINIDVQSRDNKAVISVIDNGVGIPEDELKNIWDRFYKCDKARTRSKGGTGLGLAIIKHLVKAHGEDISVQSIPGQGTTFTFTLPVQLV